jgi:hypothetical protein
MPNSILPRRPPVAHARQRCSTRKPSVIKEAAEYIPAAEAAINRFGCVVVPRELGALLAQPCLQLDDQGAGYGPGAPREQDR